MLIYLCDDSRSDILRLKHYLDTYAGKMNLTFEPVSFSSSEELLDAFQQNRQKPDLIFLDIFMSNLSGMDAARQLRAIHYQGGIIFTTSSTEHAMDSYEVDALYYLQKPYDRRHFENAMMRCGSLLQKAKPRFTFTQKKKEYSIPYTDIVFFETGQSHIVFLHAVSGVYSFRGTLAQIIAFFKGIDCFLPVGRSYFINMDHVTGLTGNDLAMSDGSIAQIPLRKREEILDAVEKWKSKSNRGTAL